MVTYAPFIIAESKPLSRMGAAMTGPCEENEEWVRGEWNIGDEPGTVSSEEK